MAIFLATKRRVKNTSKGLRGARRKAGPEMINLDEESESEVGAKSPITGTQSEVPKGETAMRANAESRDEGVLGPPMKPIYCEGKEPVGEKESLPGNTRWPHPHRIDAVDNKAWAKMKLLLMGTFLPGPRYLEEPNEENIHEPPHHLDSRWSVLRSLSAQAKAVEQFWLPKDEQFLKGILDAST